MERITRAILHRHKRGLSTLEISLIAPLIIITGIVLASLLIRLYGQVVTESHKVLLRAEAQSVVRQLQVDLQTTSSLRSTISDNVQDENQPSAGWLSNTTPPTLITENLLADRTSDTPSKAIRLQPDCLDAAPLYKIYYLQPQQADNQLRLLRRTLVPAPAALCGTSRDATSCPADMARPSCPADSVISENISDLTITYFNAAGEPLHVKDPTSNETPDQAHSAEIIVTLAESLYGQVIKESATIRIFRYGR